MVERNLIINNRELNYDGIFRVNELFNVINKALEEKKYQKNEKRSEEEVSAGGRKNYFELRPFKEVSNYVTLMIKIKIVMENITETSAEINDEKKLFQEGNVKIVFDAWSITDYEQRWGMKPWVYFARAIVDKFIYNLPTERGFTSELTSDTAYIYAQIKRLFNSYSEKDVAIVSEEEIKKEIEQEMKSEKKVKKKKTN